MTRSNHCSPRAVAVPLISLLLAACAGSHDGYGSGTNPFLTDGDAVKRALASVGARLDGPLRVTNVTADGSGLTLDVQEPKHHQNVDRYVVATDGTISGPVAVQEHSMDGGPITAAEVDTAAFDPSRIRFERLQATVREAIARSGDAETRVITWEMNGVERDDKRYLYLESQRARPVAILASDLTIENMRF